MRLLTLLICAICSPCLAQEITFTAETTTGDGEVVPVLTWSTTPAATGGCAASGDWSGARGASGTARLPAISSSATYNLTCVWLADDDVALSWINPTQNTDGSPYTDPGSTLIEYSPDGQAPWFLQPVADPAATSAVIAALEPGDWTFRAYAINARDVSSAPSLPLVVTVEAETRDQESVGITVNPVPQPPTGLSAR